MALKIRDRIQLKASNVCFQGGPCFWGRGGVGPEFKESATLVGEPMRLGGLEFEGFGIGRGVRELGFAGLGLEE